MSTIPTDTTSTAPAATTAATTEAATPEESGLMKRIRAEIKEFEHAPVSLLQRVEAIARNHFGIAPAS